MLKLRVSLGHKRAAHNALINSGKMKHTMPIVGNLILVNAEDKSTVKDVLGRKMIPFKYVD